MVANATKLFVACRSGHQNRNGHEVPPTNNFASCGILRNFAAQAITKNSQVAKSLDFGANLGTIAEFLRSHSHNLPLLRGLNLPEA